MAVGPEITATNLGLQGPVSAAATAEEMTLEQSRRSSSRRCSLDTVEMYAKRRSSWA
jgi:hypothetical protein